MTTFFDTFLAIGSLMPYLIGIEEAITIIACGTLFIIIPLILRRMPGVRCIKCAERGVETWVLPGKNCPVCRHPC